MNNRTAIQKRKKPRILAFVFGSLLLMVQLLVMAAVPGDIRYERRANESSDSESELLAFPPSIFPHWIHRIHFRCDACHDSLFEMKRGGTPVSMDLMKQGKVCGVCHNGDLAFSSSDFQSCDVCHVEIEE